MATKSGSRGLRRVLIGIGIAVAVLCALRAAAPGLCTRYLNHRLADLGGYRGHVVAVELALWRGAYVLKHLTIEKVDSTIAEPLLIAPRVDASLQWGALLHGELVAEAIVTAPTVNLVKQGGESQYGDDTDWRERLDSLSPIRVNRVEVRNGAVHFLNPDAQPRVDLFLSDINAVVSNLTNIREQDLPVFTGLNVSATAMGQAPVSLRGRLDPLQQPPRFDLNFDLRDLPLTRLNPFLLEYANLTAEAGTLSVSAEVAAADGAFDGYVKPLIDHADFLRPHDFRERPLGALWDAVVGALTELLKNQPHDRIGTRVPVRGEFDPKLGLWPAVGGVLDNMVDALLEGVDDSIDLRDAFRQAHRNSPPEDDESERAAPAN